MKKIGILGGTFNPPHIGHLFMAQFSLEELGLDKVIFVPSGKPPHKINNAEVTDPVHRLNMTKLLVDNSCHFDVSDIEVKSDEVSYTVNTLKKFKSQYVDDELYFILGADSLVQFCTWKNPDTICRYAKLAVAKRTQTDDKSFDKAIDFVKTKYNADISVVPMPTVDISSTEIRKRVKNRLDIEYMTNRDIANYTVSHGLYN